MEAMVLVNELISAGYDFAVARRLYVIACEDIGPGELGLGCTDRCDICRLPDDKERCRHPTAGSEHADADGVADMPLAEEPRGGRPQVRHPRAGDFQGIQRTQDPGRDANLCIDAHAESGKEKVRQHAMVRREDVPATVMRRIISSAAQCSTRWLTTVRSTFD
jgi:hypothetical protein